MAAIGTIQVAGNVNAGPAEVELNTLALRGVIRPPYLHTNFGAYSIGLTNGTVGSLTNAVPILDFVCPPQSTGKIIIVNSFSISASINTITTAGNFIASLFRTHGNTAGAVGSYSLTGTYSVPLKSSMPDSFAKIAFSNDLQTITVDTNALVETNALVNTVSSQFGLVIAAGAPILSPIDLYKAAYGSFPLILYPGDSLYLQITGTLNGTGFIGVNIRWLEVLQSVLDY